MSNSICVILARSGSKGIPNKNIADVGGKPLLSWTIEAAVNSERFDEVVVSTDSEDIVKIAEKFGAEAPFIRPKHLSTDDATSRDALKHAVAEIEILKNKKYDVICELQCTSPFRSWKHVQESYDLFISNRERCDSVVSFYELNHFHPFKIKKIKNDGTISHICSHFVEKTTGRRQDLKGYYARNGAIFIMSRDTLFLNNSRMGNNIIPYLMSEEDSVNIDTPLDLEIARFLAQKELKNEN